MNWEKAFFDQLLAETKDAPRTTTLVDGSARGFMSLRCCLSDRNLPVQYAILSRDVWERIMLDPTFLDSLEPVAKADLVEKGVVAVLYGMVIVTDARSPNKVLEDNTLAFCSYDEATEAKTFIKGGLKPRDAEFLEVRYTDLQHVLSSLSPSDQQKGQYRQLKSALDAHKIRNDLA